MKGIKLRGQMFHIGGVLCSRWRKFVVTIFVVGTTSP